MRTPQLGPCPSHSQRNWAVLTRLRCEQTIVAQPRVTPAGGVPRRGSQVQKKKKKKRGIHRESIITRQNILDSLNFPDFTDSLCSFAAQWSSFLAALLFVTATDSEHKPMFIISSSYYHKKHYNTHLIKIMSVIEIVELGFRGIKVLTVLNGSYHRLGAI